MNGNAVEVDKHVEQWWLWFAIALFLLLPLDLLTTLIAVAKYGTVVEANPVMRWLLNQGLVAVTAVNLAAAMLVVYLFHAAIERVRRSPPSYYRMFTRGITIWLGFLTIAGIILVSNNLLALV